MIFARIAGRIGGRLWRALQWEWGWLSPRLGFLRWLARPLLKRVWYVHPDVIMLVQATPAQCLRILAVAARPSVQRLHLRDVFAYGRRYQIQAAEDGFRLMTTSRVIWAYRRRTSASAVMAGVFTALDDSTTRVNMNIRIRVGYMLGAFLIPIFMTSIVWFVRWPLEIKVGLLVALYLLSWVNRRANAAFEANEMVYFVERALSDFVSQGAPALGGKSPEVVYDGSDFPRVWEQFYAEHRND